MSAETLFREPLANNPRRNEIVAIVRIRWLAAALAVAYPPAREPEGSGLSFYAQLGMVSSAHVQAWLKTIQAAISAGGATALNDSLMPDPTAEDGYIVLAKFWQWLRSGGYEMEKTPEALWAKLRPDTEQGLPAWLVTHKPKTGGTPGPKPDAAKDEAYLSGWEALSDVINHLHSKQGKVPTLGSIAAELKRRYPKTSRHVWSNKYLTGIKPADYIVVR